MVVVEQLKVKYSVTEEEEVEWYMKQIHSIFSGGPSGMRKEQLKLWIADI